MSLFTPYEQRPPFCQAVEVGFGTINEIADYYGQGSYESALRRGPWGMRLHITHEVTERYPNGCDLTIELLYPQDGSSEYRRQMLVYGHPPILADYDEFHARYREAKNLP
jgi:hypothetical protein